MPETKKIRLLRVNVPNFVILQQQKTIFIIELNKLLKAYLRITVICILLNQK